VKTWRWKANYSSRTPRTLSPDRRRVPRLEKCLLAGYAIQLVRAGCLAVVSLEQVRRDARQLNRISHGLPHLIGNVAGTLRERSTRCLSTTATPGGAHNRLLILARHLLVSYPGKVAPGLSLGEFLGAIPNRHSVF